MENLGVEVDVAATWNGLNSVSCKRRGSCCFRCNDWERKWVEVKDLLEVKTEGFIWVWVGVRMRW